MKIFSVPLIGHGQINIEKLSECIIDLLESAINNIKDGFVNSALIEFCKVAYLYDVIDRSNYPLDDNGEDARADAKNICSLLRVKTDSDINDDSMFWSWAVIKYRLEAQSWVQQEAS